MTRTLAIASAATLLAAAHPLLAAEVTLVRSSRLVTAAEAAGGAPLGGVVSDFYVTSDADLLVLGPAISVPVYKHPYNSNHEAPDPELVAAYPAVGASSFLQLPSSTTVLGGGFSAAGSAWGDFVDDGSQADFLFGRLTTSGSGTFSGTFYLRGSMTPVPIEFTFSLPGPSGPFTETLHLYGTEQSSASYRAPMVDKALFQAPDIVLRAPSPVEKLTSRMRDLSQNAPPVPDRIVALKAKLQGNAPLVNFAAGSLNAVPEPSSFMLCAASLPFLLCRLLRNN